MVSHLYKMNSGIPGIVSRPQESTVEQAYMDPNVPPTAFGVAVKYVASLLRQVGAGDTAASIQGLLVRPYPTSGNGTDGLGVAAPNSKFPGNVLKRGYMWVLLGAAAAASKGAPVYVRVAGANAQANKVIGNFEAASDTSTANTVGLNTSGAANTGNGTLTASTASPSTPAGAYTVQMTSAQRYSVLDAAGDPLANGLATGVSNTLDNGLALTVTPGATAFVAGDQLIATVTQNNLLLPGNSYFMGPADAAGNVEIAYNI